MRGEGGQPDSGFKGGGGEAHIKTGGGTEILEEISICDRIYVNLVLKAQTALVLILILILILI